MKFDIENIFRHFDIDSEFVNSTEIISGHINDTFRIETTNKPHYILQRINHQVFENVPRLLENKVSISKHLTSKLGHISKNELYRKVLTFARTRTGENFYRDENGNYWNLMFYVDDCVNYLAVTDPKLAFEAGRIFGEFLSLTRDFDSSKLFEVIPNFHTMSFRFAQFDQALAGATEDKTALARNSIDFANSLRAEMLKIEKLVDQNKIPLRVTHNDTKISNVLFSQAGEALCVIDTDTVMQGIVHFDFGDAIRIICNTADEDEQDLSKVGFNLGFYEAFTKGFMESMRDEISEIEVEHLAFSAKMMTFIIGLRFLTDYLNGDVYFKTKYETHNLDRAKSQFKLASRIEENMDRMNEIVGREFLAGAGV
ncbi:MAG: aminoglycoside phosphotransferase family protein [Pyrinomonadaceae bacterium]|nr:aminoglycoside phosphotransferase family protein [Pyrinomonadaceae bacterium]